MRIILFIAILLLPFRAMAQGVDPALTGMIIAFTDKAKKTLKYEESAMLGETTGHIWIRAEEDEIYDLQKQYNDYLDSFRDVVIYAAQVYGFYHEIDRLVFNMEGFAKQLDDHPTNAIAVALTPKKNTIYRELVMASVDIVNDIRQVCFSGNKMTEKQRIEIVFGIRPKLKAYNKKLQRLTKAVKYTSMQDVWLEIEGRARPRADKNRITDECFRRWRANGRRFQ